MSNICKFALGTHARVTLNSLFTKLTLNAFCTTEIAVVCSLEELSAVSLLLDSAALLLDATEDELGETSLLLETELEE